MRVLMCPPDYFRIDEEINVHMHKEDQPDRRKARKQWQELVRTYIELGVEMWFIEPQPGLQDMCFTANGGWCRWGKIIFASFSHAIRKAEEPFYELWFNKYREKFLDVATHKLPPDVNCEGQGDIVTVDLPAGPLVLMGYGQGRTGYSAAQHLAAIHGLSQEVVLPLRLVDPRFYHLDTACVFIQPKNLLLYYPGAFDSTSRRVLVSLPVKRYEVSEEDAVRFVCNGAFVEIQDRDIPETVFVTNTPTPRFREDMRAHGISVHPLDMSEFLKSGGSVRCLTLFLPDERSR